MLPNFMLVGGMKCGSTSLAKQMATHPEIFIPARKELGFFSVEEAWHRGLSYYERFFEEVRSEKAIGEVSMSYSKFPVITGVPARMAQVLNTKDLRLLYIVRHPIDRLVSQYMHRWYQGWPEQTLEDAIDTQPDMLAMSRYYQQIEQYLPFVPADRWLVVVFEEFMRDPLPVHRSIYQFLGVDPTFVPKDLSARNVTASKIRRAAWADVVRRIPLPRQLARHLLPTRLVVHSI